MFNKHFLIPLLTIFYLSCSDDPTSSEEIETVTDIDGNTYEIIKISRNILFLKYYFYNFYLNFQKTEQ